MPVTRGDVILAYVPNVGSPGGKVRSALIVQSDVNNARLNETIIAAITSNTSRVHEPTQLLIGSSAPERKESGLLHDSAVRSSDSIRFRKRMSGESSATSRTR